MRPRTEAGWAWATTPPHDLRFELGEGRQTLLLRHPSHLNYRCSACPLAPAWRFAALASRPSAASLSLLSFSTTGIAAETVLREVHVLLQVTISRG